MSDEEKKFPLPQEVQDMWHCYNGLLTLRDRYVTVRLFGYKLAVRAAKEAELARTDFWAAVYRLYPDLVDKRISYDSYKGEVSLAKAKIS